MKQIILENVNGKFINPEALTALKSNISSF